MTDSMKFGPEWIRNLSSEPFSSRSPSFIPKAQSVEKRILKKVKPKMEFCESIQNQDVAQRYSRDEMLSLFDKTKLIAPKDLKQHENLYTENIQVPLALDKTERKNINSGDLYSHCYWQSNRTLMRNHRIILNRNSYSTNSSGFNNSTSHGSTVSGNGHHNNIATSRTMRSNYNSHSSNWNGSVTNDWVDNTAARSGKYESFGENWRNKSNWRHEHFEHHNNSNVQNKWSRWRSDSENSNDKPRKNHWSSDGNIGTGGSKTSLHKSNHLEMESKIPEWATENITRMNGSFDADGSFHQRNESTSPSPISTDTNNTTTTTNTDDSIIVETTKNITNTISSDDQLSQININTIQSEPLKTAINKQPISASVSKKITTEIDHEHRLKEVANELVSTLKLDDDTATLKSNTFSDFLTFTNPLKSMISTSSTAATQQNQCLQPTSKLPPPPPNLNIMRPPPQLKPPTNSFLEDKWYYLDPQGDVQGPFSTIEMSDWYRAGYFSLSLHVRRHSDNAFMPLQELVKINPQFPFHQQKLPAAITTAGLPPAFNNSFLAHFSAVAAAMAAVNDISNNTLPTAYVNNPSDIIQNDSSKTLVDTYLNNQKKLMEQFTFLQQQAINTPPIFTPMAQNSSLSSTNYLMNLINQPQLPSVFPTMASSNLNPLSFLQTQKDNDLLTALKNSNKISSIPDTKSMTTTDLQEKLSINTIKPKIDTMPNKHVINNSSSVTNNEVLSASKPFSTFEEEMVPSSSGIVSGLKKKKERKNKNVVKETKSSDIIDYTGTVDTKTTKMKTSFIEDLPVKLKKQKNELNLNEKQKIIQPESIKTERIEKIKSKKNLSATLDELMDLKLDSSLISKQKIDKLNGNINIDNRSIDTLKKARGVIWSKVNSTVTSLSEIQKHEQQEEKKRKIERKKAEPTRLIEEEKSLGWTKLPLNSSKIAVSLKEIQAEEKKIQSQNAKIKQKAAAAASAASIASSSNKQGAWAGALTAAEFLKWTTLQSTTSTRNDCETAKSTKKEPLSSHNNLPSGFWSCNTTSLSSSSSLTPSSIVKENGKQQNSLTKTKKVISEVKNNRTEFEEWCIKLLLQVTGNDSKGVDIPELIKILIEVESANDVRDYVVNFFGEKKGVNHFITQFLDRKRKILQRRDNSKSYVDDMLAPAQAILPNEIKAKKNKKSMNKIQSTELNVRAVSRLNNMKKDHCVWNNEHLSQI